MRRPVQVLCIAAAVLGAGGTLWAIAGSDLLGRYAQLASQQQAAPNKQRLASIPSVPTAAPTQRLQREELSIEVARIDAGGSSVFAGRSAPDHRVTVLANGREIGTTIATEDGQWALVIDGGISAGPLELGIRSSSVVGGPEVVGSSRRLVVPGTAVAEAADKAPASPSVTSSSTRAPPRMASVAPTTRVADAAATGVISTPAAPPSMARTTTQPQDLPPRAAQPKGAQTADQKALEQFAAIVAKEREAVAAREREPAAGAATTAAPSASATQSTPPQAAAAPERPDPTAPANRMAAATSPAHQHGAIDSEPGRVAASLRTGPEPIPVPITFVSNQSTLTHSGEKAAALLAEYLRLKNPASITLSGHADARGPDGYNMRLSLKRLETIQRYLRAAGYSGGLSLVPRGKRDPYQGIDRRRLSLRDIYQADRRVELRMTP